MSKTVLIVDDNRINRQILCRILSGDYALLEAENGQEAIAVLHRERESIAAVMLDIVMPKMNGYEVLEQMRHNPILSQIPVIVTTGDSEAEAEKKALTLGANDYVTKPYNADILKRRLDNLIKLRETSAMINTLQKDKLTGLWNRETFFQKAEWKIRKMPENHYCLSCLDIDNFKVINDQYGTETGDGVLKALAKVLAADSENTDGLCGRIAADHFALLLPAQLIDSGPLRPRALEDRLYACTQQRVSLSIGRYRVASKSLSVSAMYDRALLAQTTVKGRYDVHVAEYDESMREQLVREQALVNDMRTALATGQFEAWFQPQYNHVTGALIGAEALARWRHPDLGLVSPTEFVPLFERNGFIYELDKFIWEQTCAALRRWLDQGRNPLPVSVNISRYDLFREDLPDVLLGLVEKYDLPEELLRLEVTESAFSQSTEQVVAVVQQFIGYGFTVEIDDFGSGYSSLNTLKDVPAQVLKLDMRFFKGADNLERGGNIIESVVRMAKWLGMSVIAEGVETQPQADYLKSIGCSYVQGYLYAKPMTCQEYEDTAKEAGKEERLIVLTTVKNLNNNTFWNPESMDSLIFNSYVGGACIIESYRGKLELIRATDRYARTLGSTKLQVSDWLKLDLAAHMSREDFGRAAAAIEQSEREMEEVVSEYVLRDLPGCPAKTYVRSTLRVIASADDRRLVYCTNENVTALREAEEEQRIIHQRMLDTDAHLHFINDVAHDLLAQPEIDKGVNGVLHKIRDFFSADRAYIIEADPGGKTCSNTYEVCAPGVTSEIANLQAVPVIAFQYWIEAFEQGGYINIPNVSALPKSRLAERAQLLEQNIHTLVAMPYHRDGKLMGFIGVDNPTKQISQTEQLRVLGEYVAVMLTRRDLTRTITVERAALQTMMDDTPGGFARIQLLPDGSDKLVYCNEGLCHLTGYTREEALSATDAASASVHPDDLDAVRARIHSDLNPGETASMKYRIRHKNGSYLWCSVFCRLTKSPEGDVFLNLYYTDLTPKEQKDLTIKQTMPIILSAIMDSSTDLAFAKDKDFNYICCSPAFVKFAGQKTEADVIGKSDYDFWEKAAADHFRADDIRLFESGVPLIDYMEVIPSDDGLPHHCKTSKYILRDSTGAIVGLYGCGRDMTESRNAAGQLQLVNDSLAGGVATFAITPDAISMLYFNDGICRMLNCTHREYAALIKEGLSSRVFPEDLPELTEQVRRLREEGAPMDCTYRNDRVNGGGYIWINLRATLTDRQGDTVFATAMLYDITEQKQAAEQAAALASQLQAVMDNMSGGVAAMTRQEENVSYLLYNHRYYEMLGYTREQFVSELPQGIKPLVLPEDQAAFAPLASTAIEDANNVLTSFRIRRRDGRIIWVEARGSAFRWKGIDDPVHVAVLYDITEERAAEEQLRSLIDALPGGIASYEATSEGPRITYFNDGFCRLMGYSREEYAQICASGTTNLTFAEDVPIVRSQVDEMRRTGVPANCLFRVRTKDGSVKWVYLRCQVTERLQDVCRYNAVLTDVTQRQALLESLRLSEERFRIGAEMSGAMLGTYDIATHTYFHNDKTLLTLGFSREIPNAPQAYVDAGIVAEESRQILLDYYAAMERGDVSGAVDVLLMRADGAYYWSRVQAQLMRDAEGTPVQAIVLTTNVDKEREKEAIYAKWQQSLREKAEDQYTLYRCNLNRNTSFDTVEGSLLQIRFDPARPRSFNDNTLAYAQAYVYPDDRAAYISLLNSDTMLASYYRGVRYKSMDYREMLPDGDVRWLQVTIELVEYPNSSEVEAYLMYEDIDKTKREALAVQEMAELDPLTGVLNRVTFEKQLNRLLLEMPLNGHCALFMLDVDGFKQLNDSFGHAAGDQALIDIATGIRALLRSGDLLGRLGGDEFLIGLRDIPHDEDIGGKAQQICNLLRKTYSLDVQLTTSIGISVSPRDGESFEALYRRADAALYTVKAAGKDNFAFFRPGMRSKTVPTPIDKELAGPVRLLERPSKRRMLIVEDNVMDLAVLSDMFADDFIIEKAKDGQTALIRLRHYGTALSVMLLDLFMPGMDGFNVLDKMAASPELQGIPVIVVSSSEDRETSLRAIRCGAVDFVTKPVDPDILRIRVQSAISKAENERLRAQNSFLSLQSDEVVKYRTALEKTGATVIEYDWKNSTFRYDMSISQHIAGNFDNYRRLWRILLSDFVADAMTVQRMQNLVHDIAGNRARAEGSAVVRLKTPSGAKHRFRMDVTKLANEFQLTDKMILTFRDLEQDEPEV